jgi:hypothetical protein
MNAALLWSQFPGLHWLASAFGAVAAYGAWGLVDRTCGSRISGRLIRAVTGVAGWSAALFAIINFMSAALGGLSLPGR